MLTKFQFHCSITCRNILYFVFWLPYCHTWWHHQYLICIRQKLWISLERYEIWQKWKHHSSSLLKAFQIHLFFNTSIFHFIGTLIRWTSKRDNFIFSTPTFVIWYFCFPRKVCNMIPLFSQKTHKGSFLICARFFPAGE